MEKWKQVAGAKKGYKVSNLGRFLSPNIGIMKTPLSHGYPHLNVMTPDKKSLKVMCHVAVARAFIPNPENKPTVNHKNGIRHDNKVKNLEWATWSEQHRHAVDVLGRKGAPNLDRQKLIIAYKDNIWMKPRGIREMARTLNIPYQGIQAIIKGKGKRYKGWKFELFKKDLN